MPDEHDGFPLPASTFTHTLGRRAFLGAVMSGGAVLGLSGSAFARPLSTGSVIGPAAAGTVQANAGHLFCAIETSAQFPNPSQTAAQENYVIVQAWNPVIPKLKAANPACKVLMYFNTNMVSGGPGGSAGGVQLYSGYPLPTSHEWNLKSSSGSYLQLGGYSSLWLADPASTGYQAAWAKQAVAQAQAVGADGVFADNTDLICSGATAPVKYPSDPTWQAAEEKFLAGVYPKLEAADLLLVPNLGSWSSYPQVGISWLPHCDGAMDEKFLMFATKQGGPATYRYSAGALGQLYEVQACAAQGKVFLGVCDSTAGDTAAAEYGLAAVMLFSESAQQAMELAPDYANEDYLTPLYTNALALGAPVGTCQPALTSGVYQYSRQFANGSVSVNLSTFTGQIMG